MHDERDGAEDLLQDLSVGPIKVSRVENDKPLPVLHEIARPRKYLPESVNRRARHHQPQQSRTAAIRGLFTRAVAVAG